MNTNRTFLATALAALSTTIAFAQTADTSAPTTKTTIIDSATNTTTTAIVPSATTTTTGATTAPGTTTTTSTTTTAGATAAPEALIMSAGSILVVRGGQTSRLEEEIKLADGSIVTPGGTVRRADGSRTTLSDGQSISISGKLGATTNAGSPSTAVGTAPSTAPAVKPQ